MIEVDVEHVLVVPTARFHALGLFQGFSRDAERYLQTLLDPALTSFRPRDEVEQDPSFKQLIPYCLLSHRTPSGRIELFQYTRGSGQGENRLHAKQSVGIGGHISQVDGAACGQQTYDEGLRRELSEEVDLRSAYLQRVVGLINDDSTPVGSVHLGVVHLFELEEPSVEPREADLLDAGFRPVEELLADTSRFESWSRICLEALFAPGEAK